MEGLEGEQLATMGAESQGLGAPPVAGRASKPWSVRFPGCVICSQPLVDFHSASPPSLLLRFPPPRDRQMHMDRLAASPRGPDS